MSENDDEVNDEGSVNDHSSITSVDNKKRLFNAVDFTEFSEEEIKKPPDLISPYVENPVTTPPTKTSSNGMTVKKHNYMHCGLINVRRIKDIQRSIFTPTKSL